MKQLLSIFLCIFISGCSVQIVDMKMQPNEQKYDLSDADADGVITARELCTTSIVGEQVDNNGCGVQIPETIRRKLLVNFDNNSYVVKPVFFDEIKKLADFMEAYPTTNVTIEGHTSKVGSRELNQTLSENRALAIKDILVSKFAIANSRITAIGYGFDRLLVTGDSESDHARNRRIVAEISSEKQITDMKWNIYTVDQAVE